METRKPRQFFVVSVIFATLLFLVFSATPLLAHEMGHHHDDEESSAHLQAMMAMKKDIPEEYRIMERSPMLPDAESLEQGKTLFRKNCSVCHGEKGDGQGPAAKSLKNPPANFLDLDHSAIYGPGEKFWLIGHGSPQTGMPAFPKLTPVERWHLVNHILHLQQENPGEEEESDHHHKPHQ